MDGAKVVADTADLLRECGRQALCKGKTLFARRGEPNRDENPGGSRILVQ